MARGGYQKPDRPAGVSGPGKFSKRTDGQAKRVEGLDSPDMQYGDRQMLEAGQSVAPVRGAAGATVRRMQGEALSGGRLPSYVLEGDSANPLEPVTSGLDIGMGPGSEVLEAGEPPEDIREVVLEYLATEFQNPQAAQHLARLREERAPAPPLAQQLPVGRPMPAPDLEAEEPTASF